MTQADLAILVERARDGDDSARDDLLRRAGAGSLEAQRIIYAACSQDYPTPLGAARIEILARMIAARTGEDRDWRCVAACLTVQALEYRRCDFREDADEAASEALAILRRLVDKGDGEALNGLAHFPEQFAHLRSAQERERVPPSAVASDALAQLRQDLESAKAEAAAAPELSRRERAKLWLLDRWWRFQFLGWALAEAGRAARDLVWR